LSITEIQPNGVLIVSHCPKAGKGLVGLTPLWLALYQTEFLPWRCPGMSLGLGKARKPAFIFLHQQPVRVLLRLLFQPVPALFFTV
jgi:hypothetical protein